MKQIVTHFTDNDLYTFSCMYYILKTYPRAEVQYTFFDRNFSRYPKGFDKLLQEQVNGMANVVATDEELDFMRRKLYFLPDWFFVFLKGYRFNPAEVNIFEDQSGSLSITITGRWYSAIMWEMPLLSTISELMHILAGDIDKVDPQLEFEKAYNKGVKAIEGGLLLSDMGTRRRFSFDNQLNVLNALKKAQTDCEAKGTNVGRFVGTSNVWFAKELNLTPIGTMSHQIISFEECVSGVFECNFNVMNKWKNTYDGDLGIYLPDAFGTHVFRKNLPKSLAKLFDGIRIDSGDEIDEMNKMIARYKELGVDPATKAIVFSNALTIDKALAIHQKVDGQMKDSYGIGTHLMADCTNTETGEKFPYSNIVIKLTAMRITPQREWHNCIKLSCDKGKKLGDPAKCEYIQKALGRLT